MYRLDDTIAAVATPAGAGGIGILRLSGPEAFPIARKLLTPGVDLPPARQALFRKFQDPRTAEALDEGLLLPMPGPRSYTAEDVVEFHVHGSPSLLDSFLRALLREGARPAEPGEFTYRAFHNGRLDLAQAEALQALISASGEAARRQALTQLTGGLSAHLEPMEEALKALYLKVEARLEFSEDGIPPLDLVKFREEVGAVEKGLQKLIESYAQGKILQDGLKVALLGPPNAGKSSLLNALLGRERAIVAATPGTTRDVVEGEIHLRGLRVRLYDTAGIRESGDEVEAEGVRRSRLVMEEADVLFWLVDAFEPGISLKGLQEADLPRDRTWILFNKTDLLRDPQSWKKTTLPCPPGRAIGLSCRTKEGLAGVVARLESQLGSPGSGEGVLLTSQRHRAEVEKALGALGRLRGLMDADSPRELWAEELKEAALAVGRIRGRNLPANAFEDIFTKFCIGK